MKKCTNLRSGRSTNNEYKNSSPQPLEITRGMSKHRITVPAGKYKKGM